MRGLLDYIFLYIKGLCIGATGVLHGISGGSIALLLGVHNKFVFSFGAIDREALRLLRKKRFCAFWKKINGNFLVILLAGVATGLLTLRTWFGTVYLEYPIFVSSFFLSLVVIAALLLLRRITRWTPGVVVLVLTGLAISYFITRTAPFTTLDSTLSAFFAGVLSGTTFILPGVSGAFMLIFLGKYQYIVSSFDSLEFDIIILFIAGSILGLTVMARFIAALLNQYANTTIALFAGLMIGSLNKIWPWREVLEYATTLKGKQIPAFDKSILPWRYLEATGKDTQIFYAILMMAAGVLMVVVIEKIAARLKTKI